MNVLLDDKECLTIRYAMLNYTNYINQIAFGNCETSVKVAQGAKIIISSIAEKAIKDKEENLLKVINRCEALLIYDALFEIDNPEFNLVSECIKELKQKFKELIDTNK